jgi:replicative DNA helicase
MSHEAKQDPLFDGDQRLSTGFIELDKITSGIKPGDLIVVASRPGMGKTAFALSIAGHVALQLKKPVAIFSMECEGAELARRLMVSVGGLNDQSLLCGSLKEDDWSKLGDAINKLTDAPIYIDDILLNDYSDIRSRSQRLIDDVPDLGMIIFDYLQLMGGRTKLLAIVQELKQLAKDLNVPIIVLYQLDRRLEARKDKRPLLSDLSSIEKMADLVIFIYREELYSQDLQVKGKAELIVAKNCNGGIGVVSLFFEEGCQRFENIVTAQDAKKDPLFEVVKKMVMETRTPSISLAQRTFRINYTRAASMMMALEGDIVTPLNEDGFRRMLTGETNEYL